MPPTPAALHGVSTLRLSFPYLQYDSNGTFRNVPLLLSHACPCAGVDAYAPNQLYLRFGENVRALRREKHLSQEELSEMVFTTQKYISCIETGRAHPSLEACLRIADALHVSIDTLLKGIIETGSEVLKPNSPEQDLLDDVIWAVHRYLENR